MKIELNPTERAMHKSLMKMKQPNIEKRWHINQTQDLIGTKRTREGNGDTQIVFVRVPRFEPLKD